MFALQPEQRLISVQLRYRYERALTLPRTNNSRPRMCTPSKTTSLPTVTISRTFSHTPPKTARITNTICNTQSSRSRADLLLGHLAKDERTSTSNSNGNDNIFQSRSASTMANSKTTNPYIARKIGAPNTSNYRVYFEKNGVPLSPFHDIPLYANDQQTILNMVVEIPRWTNAKMEVNILLFFLMLTSWREGS